MRICNTINLPFSCPLWAVLDRMKNNIIHSKCRPRTICYAFQVHSIRSRTITITRIDDDSLLVIHYLVLSARKTRFARWKSHTDASKTHSHNYTAKPRTVSANTLCKMYFPVNCVSKPEFADAGHVEMQMHDDRNAWLRNPSMLCTGGINPGARARAPPIKWQLAYTRAPAGERERNARGPRIAWNICWFQIYICVWSEAIYTYVSVIWWFWWGCEWALGGDGGEGRGFEWRPELVNISTLISCSHTLEQSVCKCHSYFTHFQLNCMDNFTDHSGLNQFIRMLCSAASR